MSTYKILSDTSRLPSAVSLVLMTIGGFMFPLIR